MPNPQLKSQAMLFIMLDLWDLHSSHYVPIPSFLAGRACIRGVWRGQQPPARTHPLLSSRHTNPKRIRQHGFSATRRDGRCNDSDPTAFSTAAAAHQPMESRSWHRPLLRSSVRLRSGERVRGKRAGWEHRQRIQGSLWGEPLRERTRCRACLTLHGPQRVVSGGFCHVSRGHVWEGSSGGSTILSWGQTTC